MKERSRYIIGIDLGTTNCAVSYFDTHKGAFQLFRIPQKGKLGYQESLTVLPSLLFLDDEQATVGMWAQIQGKKSPTRLIQSAKSWLSNPAACRKEKILPFEACTEEKKLSPVEASMHYLDHIRKMWNQEIAKSDLLKELEEQEVILTVPASFDEVARTLTVEAAKLAGYKNFTLLEEPQAAFYSYLMEFGKKQFKPGETILVCDVGGGTTDFSLIDVVESGIEIGLRRMAVGKHLLLGGDNMDVTLSYYLQRKYQLELDTSQRLSLLNQVRSAKELLLEENSPQENYSLFISGTGSQVVGGGIALEISKREVDELLLDGFFGVVPFEDAVQINKGSGLRHMGLPYESDPSITKQLAHFLHTSKREEKPTYVLFNGGAMKPNVFQKRMVDSLNLWYGEKFSLTILPSKNLDLAVSKGAAYYGKVRRGEGERIQGGIPRSYYLAIETETNYPQVLTLLARGSEEGTVYLCDYQFFMKPNQPVVFQLYHSNTRLKDDPGSLVAIDETAFTLLPPIQTICAYGKKESKETIPVKLETRLTELGTIELWLLSQNSIHKWKLEFQIRGELQEERSFDKRLVDETFDTTYLELAKEEVRESFAIGAQEKLKMIMPSLEQVLNQEKKEWSPSVLRGLFEILYEQADKRLLSQQYEQRFWNLAGFFLRPGAGYPLDDYRIKQLWKLILSEFRKPKSEEVQLQQWICFRRVAAGFGKGQQIQLYNHLIALMYDKKKNKLVIKGKKGGYVYAELLRAIASFELVEIHQKILLGEALLNKIEKGDGEPCDFWALGRLGARQLFHGSLANIIPAKQCEIWVNKLLNSPAVDDQHFPFTLLLLARKTDVEEMNLSSDLLEKISPLLKGNLEALLRQQRELSLAEQDHVFGDALPIGLKINLH